MESIIKNGAYSLLSIFPMARTISNDKLYHAVIEKLMTAVLKNIPFIQRVHGCAAGCSGKKNESFRCSCFDVVDSFMGGENSAGEPRIYLGTTYTIWCEKTLRLDIFLKLIPKKNVGIVNFNFSIDGLSVQEAIALRHVAEVDISKTEKETLDIQALWKGMSCFSSSAQKTCGPLEGKAMSRLFHGLYKELRAQIPKMKKTKGNDDILVNEILSFEPKFKLQTIMELNSIEDLVEWEQNTHLWAEKHAQMVYGLITGDEGIGFIPEDFAKERISEHWASRDFFDAIAIKNNVMLINSKATGVMGRRYMDYQREWNNRFNGGEARIQYFTGKPCIAGFDHGILNAVERNMVILFYYDFIDHQEKKTEKQLNKQRQKLLSFISSSMSSIDEINELYDTISRASKTDLSIARVRNRLDIQSEEMNIDYQYKNNDVIFALTFLSLAIAIIAIQKQDNLFVGLDLYSIVSLVVLIPLCCIVAPLLCTWVFRWLRNLFGR